MYPSFDEFVLTPPSNRQSSPSLYGGYAGSINFCDMDAELAQSALAGPEPRTLPTPPTDSMALDRILGLDLIDEASSSDVTKLEPMGKSTLETISQTPSSRSVSSRQSSSRASFGEPRPNSPGWMSALHMAAQRGHGTIVRLCE